MFRPIKLFHSIENTLEEPKISGDTREEIGSVPTRDKCVCVIVYNLKL